MDPPLSGCSTRKIPSVMQLHGCRRDAAELVLVAWVQESWPIDQLSFYLGPGPGFQLAKPNIYPIYELLMSMEG